MIDLLWIYKNYTLKDFYKIAASCTVYRIEILRRMFIPKRETKKELNYEGIEITIERGRKWLEDHQRADGSIGEIEPRQWEIWNTANAALALIQIGGDDDCIENAINFVMGGQLNNGSFSFNYVPKNLTESLYFNCIETASVALLAAYIKRKKVSENIKRGADFLIKIQNGDGSWELPYIPTNAKYPSVTGFALKTLLYLKVCPEKTFKKALLFIESAQLRNGSWGRAPEYYNTESYAIKNISDALILAKNEERLMGEEKERIDLMLQRCIPYVVKRQNSDGSWSARGPSSKCISTALYLQTLLNLSDKNDEKNILLIKDAVSFLMEKQEKEGFWKGGNLGRYSADFFATSEVLIALDKVLNKSRNVNFTEKRSIDSCRSG
ncbi:MAG: terpene cyclase/mutase family protein [Candidatus Methanoperedens sp.]|nr:terpene cyclase/mutase family protein [Candidatus Methanoperedens sp.]